MLSVLLTFLISVIISNTFCFFQAYRNQVSGRTNLAEAGNSRYRGTTMLTKLPISQGTQAMYKVNLHDLKLDGR